MKAANTLLWATFAAPAAGIISSEFGPQRDTTWDEVRRDVM